MTRINDSDRYDVLGGPLRRLAESGGLKGGGDSDIGRVEGRGWGRVRGLDMMCWVDRWGGGLNKQRNGKDDPDK